MDQVDAVALAPPSSLHFAFVSSCNSGVIATMSVGKTAQGQIRNNDTLPHRLLIRAKATQ